MQHACPLWKETVENSKLLEAQTAEFRTKYLTKISNRISESLQLTSGLSPEYADYIYKACAFSIAFFDETKTWCSLLNKDEILKLEYFSDLIDYYSFSYGNELNE